MNHLSILLQITSAVVKGQIGGLVLGKLYHWGGGGGGGVLDAVSSADDLPYMHKTRTLNFIITHIAGELAKMLQNSYSAGALSILPIERSICAQSQN